MKRNIGYIDSIIRLTIAVIITLLYLFNLITILTAIGLFAVGILMFFTSIAKRCPIYSFFGLSTFQKRKRV